MCVVEVDKEGAISAEAEAHCIGHNDVSDGNLTVISTILCTQITICCVAVPAEAQTSSDGHHLDDGETLPPNSEGNHLVLWCGVLV